MIATVDPGLAYGSAYWRLPPAYAGGAVADDSAHVAPELAIATTDADGRDGEPVTHAPDSPTPAA